MEGTPMTEREKERAAVDHRERWVCDSCGSVIERDKPMFGFTWAQPCQCGVFMSGDHMKGTGDE